MVTNLRRFARSDDGALAATDLNGTLESVIKITANELAAECDVRRDFAELPPVRCHPAQIQQALIQVLVNAFQAVADGGTVSVRTRVVDDHVEIAISDDGPGIDPDHLDKLFTPFFTTRPVGQGSGLGLSSAYGIVRRHGGEIRVMSEPGKGATFVVRLPVAEPSEETPLSSSAA